MYKIIFTALGFHAQNANDVLPTSLVRDFDY